jgi:Family of unknown function (DUF5335)
MKTREIAFAEWPDFFREFSRRHEDWLVTLRVITPILGAQVAASDLPLVGVVAEEAQGAVSIYLGRDEDDRIEHPGLRPVRAWVELQDDGAEKAVEFESADGAKTLLEFPVTHPPEPVDGIGYSI